jgi:hypothetical protein
LCLDVRGVILSKLCHWELAVAARTCREFHDACVRSRAEERERAIAVGEETYGKATFSGFVTAFYDGMVNLDILPTEEYLLIDSAGKPELMCRGRVRKMSANRERLACIRKCEPAHPYLVVAKARAERPARGTVLIRLPMYTAKPRLEVKVGRKASQAAAALLTAVLARKGERGCTTNPEGICMSASKAVPVVCTGNPEGVCIKAPEAGPLVCIRDPEGVCTEAPARVPTVWQVPFELVVVDIGSRERLKVAQAAFEPLGPLTKSMRWFRYTEGCVDVRRHVCYLKL